jgi:DNA-binding protein YbaB
VAPAPERPPATEGPLGRGTAGDGQILVTAAGGRLDSVELDPQAMRLCPGLLVEQIALAVYAALTDLRRQSPASAAGTQVDLAAVARELPAVRDQAMREMSQIVAAIHDGLAELRRHGQVTGGVEVPDAQQLFDGLEQLLGQMTGGHPADAGAEPAEEDGRGLGQAGPGGLVRAVAVPGGRIVSLTIDARAVQEGSRQLAGYLVAAVNGALDEAARALQARGPVAPVDRDQLKKQLAQLRETSLQQMQTFSSSLSSLLGTIRAETPRR